MENIEKVDFSEELKGQGVHAEEHGEDSSTPQKQDTPTMEELSKKLEEANRIIASKTAEYDKLKKGFDTASTDVAKYKKELQAKMSEEEKIKAEQDEANAKAQAELNALREQVQKATATKRYVGYGLNDKDAETCAKAELEHDMDTILKLIKGHHEADIKNRETEWLNKRPDPAVGGEGKADNLDAFEKGFG